MIKAACGTGWRRPLLKSVQSNWHHWIVPCIELDTLGFYVAWLGFGAWFWIESEQSRAEERAAAHGGAAAARQGTAKQSTAGDSSGSNGAENLKRGTGGKQDESDKS